MVCIVSLFLFFKQKTAYEMRISDWSSDVCSSDLRLLHLGGDERAALPVGQPVDRANVGALVQPEADDVRRVPLGLGAQPRMVRTVERSEEHTSELQSLMRISYAVFCLKKKKNITSTTRTTINIEQHTHTLERVDS